MFSLDERDPHDQKTFCAVCQSWRHSPFSCGRDDCGRPETPTMQREVAKAMDVAREFRVLMADHSEALKFVREMAIQPCPHWCAGDCLACRAKAWLHEARK